MTEKQGSAQVQIKPSVAARQIWDLFQRNNGATFNLYSGSLGGKDLYAVSIYRDREIIDDADVTVEMIEAYISRNLDLLSDPHNSVGLWLDGEESYFDVSVTLPDRREAVALALAHDQLAICHLTDLAIEYVDSLRPGE